MSQARLFICKDCQTPLTNENRRNNYNWCRFCFNRRELDKRWLIKKTHRREYPFDKERYGILKRVFMSNDYLAHWSEEKSFERIRERILKKRIFPSKDLCKHCHNLVKRRKNSSLCRSCYNRYEQDRRWLKGQRRSQAMPNHIEKRIGLETAFLSNNKLKQNTASELFDLKRFHIQLIRELRNA